MDKAMRECPHPNIRIASQLNYILRNNCACSSSRFANSRNRAPFAQGCVAFSIFSII
jgi:hypothetical protein